MACRKNVLIVYAHPDKASFNAALLDAATSSLRGQGHDVVVSDLYEMKFNPVLSRDDVKEIPASDSGHIGLSSSFQEAFNKGRLADDIAVEQAKVLAADLIIFQFQLFWGSMPAIMKGWVDRVMCMGFSFTTREIYDDGKLRGRKAVLSITTADPGSFYTDAAPNGDINVYLWPLQNSMLHLAGLKVLAPHINYGIALPSCSPAMRDKMLDDWRIRLEGIFEEKCINFIPSDQFKLLNASNVFDGLKVGPKIDEHGKVVDEGYNIGQHLGKKVPADSMTIPRT